MSTNRDTHFAGFAKLQWNKIEALLRNHGCIPVGQMVEPEFFPEIEVLLTQNAYDLAVYILMHTTPASGSTILKFQGLSIEEIAGALPDLTEWPVEPNDVGGSNPA